MGQIFRHRSAELLVLCGAALFLAFAGACNSLTGVGDLHVSGAGGENGAAGGGTTHPGAGGGGVGGAGIGGAGVGPGSTASAGNGTQSTSVTGTGTATTTSVGPTTTAGPSTVASTGTSMSNDPAQFCVDTINSYRATRGLGPMSRWSSNESCVSSEAQTDGTMMSAHYAFIHGMNCGANAQNECPNYASDPLTMGDGIATCLQLMWDEKDQPGCAGCDTCDFPYQNCTNCEFDGPDTVCGHYLNMKSAVLSTVACGFWTGGWYAQDYK